MKPDPKGAGTINRDSSIELLRIFTMFIIVLCHFSGFSFGSESTHSAWWYFLQLGGNLGTDIFVLICGWFLCRANSPVFNPKKLIRFLAQVIFYSVSIYLIFVLCGKAQFSIKDTIKAFIPITSGAWWFASTYFVLYLLHPFINIMIRAMTQKEHLTLAILCFFCFSLIPTFTLYPYESNSLVFFVSLYIIAGYLHIYGVSTKIKHWHYLAGALLFTFLRFLSAIVISRLPSLSGYYMMFYNKNSVLTVLSSICFLMYFKDLNLKPNKLINTISSATFGVYLLHENELMRNFIWKEIFTDSSMKTFPMVLPYALFAAVTVYIACTIIDLLRKRYLEGPFMRLVSAVDISRIISKNR